MLSQLFSRVRQIVMVVFVGLIAAPLAQADEPDAIKSCFNFLAAQDYARAENTASTLLKRGDLSREEQRHAHLCLGRAYDSMGYKRDALPEFLQVELLSQTTKGHL